MKAFFGYLESKFVECFFLLFSATKKMIFFGGYRIFQAEFFARGGAGNSLWKTLLPKLLLLGS